MPGEGLAWRPWHGWLPAVLPASARTFRAADPELADTLRASGAAAGLQPDVELATSAAGLTGDAPCAIVFLHERAAEGAGVPGRVAARLGGAARTARGVAQARRRLRDLGCAEIEVVPFDQERRPALAPPGTHDARALPLGAIVVGRRARADATTVLEAAGAAAGERVARADARVGLSGVVLVVGERRVLRVVLRAGEEQIAAGVGFLRALRAAGPPPGVEERIAWPEAEGELPLARWVLEPRLPGAPADDPGDAFLADCVDFLADIFGVPVAAADAAPGLAESARLVASACPPALAPGVVALGERVAAQLAGVPRGVAHGDFWRDNLLADGGRLRGVVDWSGAGGGRLPLLDLLHLLVDRAEGPLGDAITGWLLPELERGGGPLVRAYCRRLGLEPDPPLLRALAAAYWLDHIAHHLRSYADRAQRPAWLARNVHAPAAAFSAAR
jgi:hypothetical protein